MLGTSRPAAHELLDLAAGVPAQERLDQLPLRRAAGGLARSLYGLRHRTSTSSRECWTQIRRKGESEVSREHGIDRFESKIKKTRRCWLWMAWRLPSGYGMFKWKGRMHLAHRVAYEIYKGPILSGNLVLHGCDNPSCVRPSHLKLGSQKDNMMDMFMRGRDRKGSERPTSKLSESDVVEIRRIRAKGSLYRDIARKFGVSAWTASQAARGVRWKHVAFTKEA